MISILGKFGVVSMTIYTLAVFGFAGNANAGDIGEAETLNALDDAKEAFIKKDYSRMWQEVDKITKWLEANSPRSGLAWNVAEQMIKDWIKKNWREKVIEVKPLSEGGMETTTERHQGSFYGGTWDTGQKTITTDFVFEASVKALNSKGKELNHKIRFHFDKGPTGWSIKRAGVM